MDLSESDPFDPLSNSDALFRAVAEMLRTGMSAIVGWTDGRHSHYDILFTLRAIPFGPLQFGLQGVGELFVSVMRIGAFGFRLDRREDLHWEYVAEKLSVSSPVTAQPLAELINGVMRELTAPPGTPSEAPVAHE